jgi:hypothetical protein
MHWLNWFLEKPEIIENVMLVPPSECEDNLLFQSATASAMTLGTSTLSLQTFQQIHLIGRGHQFVPTAQCTLVPDLWLTCWHSFIKPFTHPHTGADKRPVKAAAVQWDVSVSPIIRNLLIWFEVSPKRMLGVHYVINLDFSSFPGYIYNMHAAKGISRWFLKFRA